MQQKLFRLIFALLGLSVAAGCDSDDHGDDIPYAYGPMPASFIVKGKVTDTKRHPVAGIGVQFETGGRKLGRLLTDKQGDYRLELPVPLPELDCLFLDIDGAENGWFEDQRHRIPEPEADAERPVTVELNVALEEKRPQ